MLPKKTTVLSCLIAAVPSLNAQTIQIEPVEVQYGDQLYIGQHQVVISSPEDVTIIPPEQPKLDHIANMVVSASPNKLSYIEESAIAKREQEIYQEVTRRTEESPFTVLFTGHIPDEIQQRRLSMMPEIGIFGDQREKLDKDQADLHGEETQTADAGEFSEVMPGERIQPSAKNEGSIEEPSNQAELTNEQKLEQLIGG